MDSFHYGNHAVSVRDATIRRLEATLAVQGASAAALDQKVVGTSPTAKAIYDLGGAVLGTGRYVVEPHLSAYLNRDAAVRAATGVSAGASADFFAINGHAIAVKTAEVLCKVPYVPALVHLLDQSSPSVLWRIMSCVPGISSLTAEAKLVRVLRPMIEGYGAAMFGGPLGVLAVDGGIMVAKYLVSTPTDSSALLAQGRVSQELVLQRSESLGKVIEGWRKSGIVTLYDYAKSLTQEQWVALGVESTARKDEIISLAQNMNRVSKRVSELELLDGLLAHKNRDELYKAFYSHFVCDVEKGYYTPRYFLDGRPIDAETAKKIEEGFQKLLNADTEEKLEAHLGALAKLIPHPAAVVPIPELKEPLVKTVDGYRTLDNRFVASSAEVAKGFPVEKLQFPILLKDGTCIENYEQLVALRGAVEPATTPTIVPKGKTFNVACRYPLSPELLERVKATEVIVREVDVNTTRLGAESLIDLMQYAVLSKSSDPADQAEAELYVLAFFAKLRTRQYSSGSGQFMPVMEGEANFVKFVSQLKKD